MVTILHLEGLNSICNDTKPGFKPALAKRLLVDDKITACVKGICKVLNRKTLSGLSLVKHFAFLKISKFCASSNLLFFF